MCRLRKILKNINFIASCGLFDERDFLRFDDLQINTFSSTPACNHHSEFL
jgi:hypothetical protein